MTIATSAAEVQLEGDGVTTIFNYNFIIPYEEDGSTPAAEVRYTDTSDNITLLPPSSYTITDVGNALGGTVIYAPAIPVGSYLTITRTVSLTQPDAFSNQSFLPSAVESVADLLELQIQQVDQTFDRALLMPQGLPLDPVTYFQSIFLQIGSAVNTAFFGTTASLLAAFAAPVVLIDGSMFLTAGRNTQNDGGGAIFYYKASDVTSADNGGTIRVDTQGRRFYAVIWGGQIPVELFGVFPDGADHAAAMNKALLAGAAANARVVGSGGTYKFNATLTWDVSRTSIGGNGSSFDFTNLAASPGLQPFTTCPDPNIMTPIHRAHKTTDIRLLGPDKASGFSAITPVASTIASYPWIPGLTWDRVGLVGWAVGYDIVSGDFFVNFDHVSFEGAAGTASGFFLRSVGANNSGENMSFDNLIVTNAEGFYLETVANANMDIFLHNPSIDGSVYIATGGTLAAPGTAGIDANITMFGAHFEASAYTDYLAWIGAAGALTLFSPNILLPETTAHVPFRCDATQVGPGITIRDAKFTTGGGSWNGGHICDGAGRFIMSASGFGNTFLFPGAVASNCVPSNTWPSSDSLTTNWTGSPQYDNADFPAGAVGSCKLDGAHLNATISVPCAPGQTASFQCQLKITAPGAGDKVALVVKYKDFGGNTLGGTESDISTAAAYTLAQALNELVAPPGTVSVVVTVVYIPSGGGATVRFGLPEIQVV